MSQTTPKHPESFSLPVWRSVEDSAGWEGEFPAGATEPPSGMARREFLEVLGATFALSGLAACTNKPRERVYPYAKLAPALAPGNPLHFATACAIDGYASGLLVTSWEGRPTKIEGNPDHPWNRGATGPFEQALLLDLYDPHRAKTFAQSEKARSWSELLAWIAAHRHEHYEPERGARLRFLGEPDTSLLHAELRARIQERYPKTGFHWHAPARTGNASRGARIAFGQALEPRFDFAKADLVLSLDFDFLRATPELIGYHRPFTQRRDPSNGPLNRLYVVETAYSLTGAMADHRLRARPSQVARVALALAQRMSELPELSPFSKLPPPSLPIEQAHWVAAVANDLKAHRGRGLVLAGERQPPAVHALVHALNHALSNLGTTSSLHVPLISEVPEGASLAALIAQIDRGEVETLVITADDPAYSAPSDLLFAEALKKVPHVLYWTRREDLTAKASEWKIPAAHPLESWGDLKSVDGTTAICQPLIEPMFGSVTQADLLGAFAMDAPASTHDELKNQWRARTGSSTFDREWEGWLAQGSAPSPARPVVRAELKPDAILAAIKDLAPSGDIEPMDGRPAVELEVSFELDYRVHDGRFAFNPWLQELPDPVSRISWDNVASISPATGAQLSLKTGDLVELTYRGKTLEVPVAILPGHADGVVTLPLGYGRQGAASFGTVGFNAYLLRRSDAPWFDRGLRLSKTGRRHRLADAQMHWTMEGRPLALSLTQAGLVEHQDKLSKLRGDLPTLYPKPAQDEGYRWAMSIDLSRCTGCSACVLACQSENNIPVVGKEQVILGREMHWLRIDRYFQGPPEAPEAITQPVACVHCESAPCEYVCPVNATVHSDEGLNEMVYNRCVGTRYCSNNCPYKVRRFNYLHFTAGQPNVQNLAQNPDVTVRARGVMEKCTYCVQRIERARVQSRIEGRTIAESDLKTACQQVCPAEAIHFGSLHDPKSQVSVLHRDQRRYDLLHELNTRPRTAYLVRVKNPNPEIA